MVFKLVSYPNIYSYYPNIKGKEGVREEGREGGKERGREETKLVKL